MKVQLWRHATLLITMNGKRILADPMLGEKGSLGKLPMIKDERQNPLTDLPFSREEYLTQIAGIDAVLVSHLHPDHWDQEAINRIDKNIPLLCSTIIADAIREAGFTNVISIEDALVWEGIQVQLTGGQHGTGEIGQQMGIVHGFVLSYADEILYIAGDTIWCPEVRTAVDRHQPHWIIVNGGGAKFDLGDPITMTIQDILTVASYAPKAKLGIVHLDTISHCHESRAMIRQALQDYKLSGRCVVANDGEAIV